MHLCHEEREYKWLEAAKSYEQVLKSPRLTFSSITSYWQRIGYCYDRASRQTKDVDGFRDLRQLAVKAYEKAAALFGEDANTENQGKSAQCLALAEHARSWLAASYSEKQQTLDKCHVMATIALATFEKSGNRIEYGNTASILCQCLLDRLKIAGTGEEAKAISKEGINTADAAITFLSKLENKDELLIAFSLASLQTWYAANISEQEKEEKTLAERCLSFSENALKLSEQVDRKSVV
jgi:hypothetical protein